MRNNHTTNTFGELFRTYRLRAGIETLAMFANLMAEKGLVYENSLFSRWQRNERIPRERKIIIAALQIFAARGGITCAQEANEFLQSVDQRELTADELEQISRTSNSFHISNKSQYETSAVQTKDLVHISYKSVLKTHLSWLLISIFFIQLLWFYRIWSNGLYGTLEGYICGWTYGFIGILGAAYGLFTIKRWPQLGSDFSNQIRTTSKYLCYGLLGQCFGLQIWFIYNLRGVDMPYPSLAELGYFSTIPSYILSSLALTNVRLSKKLCDFELKKIVIFSLPIFTLVISLSTYLAVSGINLLDQFTAFFSLIYPVGDILPIIVVFFFYIFRQEQFARAHKDALMMLSIGFFMQFIADYVFILSAKNGSYITSGVVDILLMSGYLYMALIIVALTNANTALATNNVPLSNRAIAKQTKPLHMSRRLAHLEP